MIGLTLMQGIALTTGTTSSQALMLVAGDLEIEFDLTCSGGPSTVKYYIEYSEDLVTWFREVAEEDAGRGIVLMPKALRTLADNGSTTIADNPHFKASCQFVRKAPFARVQMSATAGTVVVNSVTAPFGMGPYGTIQTVAAPAPSCLPVGLHTDGTQGTFTLTGASVTPIILGTAPYDFTCTGDAHVELFGTVDSQALSIIGGPTFPNYGIFIVSVVPPAADLFSIILPDVNMFASPPDLAFHTFTDTNTIVNPAGPRFVVFAVTGVSIGSHEAVPGTYNYKNFILDVTGV
jgi:hypothetical protein